MYQPNVFMDDLSLLAHGFALDVLDNLTAGEIRDAVNKDAADELLNCYKITEDDYFLALSAALNERLDEIL